ncbi:UbiA prenyltransferase [Peniophora sp. CONT]|nr:UbiA prenyltransferase [Peniophora sp. CONT]
MAHSVLRDYIQQVTRLDSFPLGTAITFWPAAFGVTMAAIAFDISIPDFVRQLLCVGIGCTLLHSTICVLNDIAARNIDGLVERTKQRPLVIGAVPLRGAWILFAGLLSILICILLALANETTVTFGLLSLPLHVLYPYSKRWTWWPQAWLGISIGWSIFVGWFSIAGARSSRTNTLAVVLMCSRSWAIYYDTVYASQDVEDDTRIGVLSTARLFESRVQAFTTCFATCVVLLLIYNGTLNEYGVLYYTLTCGGASCHFLWQLSNWEPKDNESSAKIFKVLCCSLL